MKKAKNHRPKNLNDLSVASKKVMKEGLNKPTITLCVEPNKGGYPTLKIYTVVKKKAKRKIKEQDRAIEKVVWKSIEVMLSGFITYLLSKILS